MKLSGIVVAGLAVVLLRERADDDTVFNTGFDHARAP
jgi:hypothetical protein